MNTNGNIPSYVCYFGVGAYIDTDRNTNTCYETTVDGPISYFANVCMSVFMNLHFGEHACKDLGTKV